MLKIVTIHSNTRLTRTKHAYKDAWYVIDIANRNWNSNHKILVI